MQSTTAQSTNYQKPKTKCQRPCPQSFHSSVAILAQRQVINKTRFFSKSAHTHRTTMAYVDQCLGDTFEPAASGASAPKPSTSASAYPPSKAISAGKSGAPNKCPKHGDGADQKKKEGVGLGNDGGNAGWSNTAQKKRRCRMGQ